MTDRIIIYRSESLSPYFNLAAEEYLTANAPPGALLLFLWRNADTVVIGKNQNCYAECDIPRMKSDGVRLARRLSGGGAVWHDAGNLCFSFITGCGDSDTARQLSVIRRACAAFGLDAQPCGRNDLALDGRKFSGNAFYIKGRNRCHHGTVLISGDLARLAAYLTVPRVKLEAKGIESVRSRVVNLSEYAPALTAGTFSAAVAGAAGDVYGVKPEAGTLPPLSLFAAGAEYFASSGWLYGVNPPCSAELSGRFPFGGVTLRLDVIRGKIAACRVITDALDPELPGKIAGALTGVAYDAQSCRDALSPLEHGGELAGLFAG